jgi:hypothetical protein
MANKSPLQKILKGILYTINENEDNHERMEFIKPQDKNRQVIRE